MCIPARRSWRMRSWLKNAPAKNFPKIGPHSPQISPQSKRQAESVYSKLLKANPARVAKLADARDLKSRVPKGTYRFDSGPGHQVSFEIPRCASGFRLRAPAALTPAKHLNLKSRDGIEPVPIRQLQCAPLLRAVPSGPEHTEHKFYLDESL